MFPDVSGCWKYFWLFLDLFGYFSNLYFFLCHRCAATLLHVRYPSLCTVKNTCMSIVCSWCVCLCVTAVIFTYNFSQHGPRFAFFFFFFFFFFCSHLTTICVFIFCVTLTCSPSLCNHTYPCWPARAPRLTAKALL